MNQTTLSALTAAQTNVGNYEGGQTFSRSPRERVLQLLTVGIFGDTFYAGKRELEAEWKDAILKARSEDPEFLAKAIVYGRNRGLIKDQNVLALAELSGGRGKTREPFETIFDQVICIPDDLRVFTGALLSGQVAGKKGLGGYVVKSVAKWLTQMSEYHTLKYGSAASEGVSLRDIVRMTHPRTDDDAVAERLGWLVSGKLGSNPELNPQIRAYVALKLATTEDEAIALIQKGRLPFEVVVPAVKHMTPRIWEELLYQAPYMNLLRNLVTFTRHGVFQKETNVQRAVEKLSNQQAVERSKVLPFRFFDAWRKYVGSEGFDSRIADTLRAALNLSFANMPSFGNATVALGVDVSGSMSTTPISERGETQCIDIAGIFTGALLRKIEGRAISLPFETCVIADHGLSGRDDVMVTAEKIHELGGGGTALGSPIQRLLDRKVKVDAFVGLTDNEDWAYGSGFQTRDSFISLWRQYRAVVNPQAQAFVVQLAPYSHAVAPANEPGVRFIYGWSDAVVKYIPLMLEGGESQLREISRMNLRQAEIRQSPEAPDDAQ